MRIIWKDSKERKPIKYRGYHITGVTGGWITDYPGDTHVYTSHYCAENAIDAYLGGGRASKKRRQYGIRYVK